jgi:hypothetical protein
MHIRGPLPNGRYAWRLRAATAAGRKRSGANTSGRSHADGWRWTNHADGNAIVPAGTRKPRSVVSACAVRARNHTGGKSRIASCSVRSSSGSASSASAVGGSSPSTRATSARTASWCSGLRASSQTAKAKPLGGLSDGAMSASSR